jgi:hypothetical protein
MSDADKAPVPKMTAEDFIKFDQLVHEMIAAEAAAKLWMKIYAERAARRGEPTAQ